MPPVLPKKVTLRFPSRGCPWYSSMPETWTASATTALDGALLGEETYIDTALALFQSGVTPANSAVLQSLADQFAADLLAWRQTQYDQSLIGVAAVEPTGLGDVEWDLSSARVRTRLHTPAWNFRVARLGHQVSDPDNTSNCPNGSTGQAATKAPCVVMYGPPVPSGNTNTSYSIDKYSACLQDGRLTNSYIGKDIFTCGCVSTPPFTGCTGCNFGTLFPTIYITDAAGTTACNWFVTSNAWIGTTTVAQSRTVTRAQCNAGVTPTPAPGNVPIQYIIQCNGNAFSIQRNWAACNPTAAACYWCSDCALGASDIGNTPEFSSCSPFPLSGTLNAGCCIPSGVLVCGNPLALFGPFGGNYAYTLNS